MISALCRHGGRQFSFRAHVPAVTDLFPEHQVGRAAGLMGIAGDLGDCCFRFSRAFWSTASSYTPVFLMVGLMPLFGTIGYLQRGGKYRTLSTGRANSLVMSSGRHDSGGRLSRLSDACDRAHPEVTCATAAAASPDSPHSARLSVQHPSHVLADRSCNTVLRFARKRRDVRQQNHVRQGFSSPTCGGSLLARPSAAPPTMPAFSASTRPASETTCRAKY